MYLFWGGQVSEDKVQESFLSYHVYPEDCTQDVRLTSVSICVPPWHLSDKVWQWQSDGDLGQGCFTVESFASGALFVTSAVLWKSHLHSTCPPQPALLPLQPCTATVTVPSPWKPGILWKVNPERVNKTHKLTFNSSVHVCLNSLNTAIPSVKWEGQ